MDIMNKVTLMKHIDWIDEELSLLTKSGLGWGKDLLGEQWSLLPSLDRANGMAQILDRSDHPTKSRIISCNHCFLEKESFNLRPNK